MLARELQETKIKLTRKIDENTALMHENQELRMKLSLLESEPKKRRVSFGENEIHDINNDESLKTGSSQELLPYLDEKTNPLNAAMMAELESDSDEAENTSTNLDISDDQMVIRRESVWLQS